MTTNQTLLNQAFNANQSIFLLCDHCFWTATCLDKLHINHVLGTAYVQCANINSYLVFQLLQMNHLHMTIPVRKG